MFGLIARWFGNNIVVRIGRERLLVREPRRDLVFDEPPLLAISDPPRRAIVAVGRAAAALRGRPGTTVVNPFDHPRTPLSDFVLAEQLLRHVVRTLQGPRWLGPAPAMVIGLDAEPEGGLTQIEVRALRELALGAGASRGIVWSGPPLSDEQVIHLRFPTTGDVLE